MADKCEKAWKLGRLGEMFDLLKKLWKHGEYNNSKNVLLFSEERLIAFREDNRKQI